MRVNILTSLVTALIIAAAIGTTSCSRKPSGKDICTLPAEFIFTGDTPGFDAGVFQARRERLMEKMKGDIIIISAASGNDFIYLTGYRGDRQAIAVLNRSSTTPFTLFVLPREPMATLWDGERPGTEGAIATYGADAAYPIDEFNKKITEIIAGGMTVSMHRNDRSLIERLKKLKTDTEPGSLIFDLELGPGIHEMRVFKDNWEIAQLEKAIEVTCLAHRRVLQTVAPGQKEYDVQAEIEYVFRKNGLSPGFSTIVGSGPNAAILHYPHNDRIMVDGDLLLIDIGASSSGYIADVTRTIPVNGKFSDKQRELYSLVLKANQEAIKIMVPGNHILDGHHKATQIITQGLYEMGLITDTTSWWQRRFYIHYRNIHYIGLNVHDVGSYGDFDAADRDSFLLSPEIRGRQLEPNMVMTIEPGIYLVADRLEHLHGLFGDKASAEELDAFAEKVRPVYEKYAGIGIRIEDVVLITADGNRVLSAIAPKTIEEIEKVMKK